MLRRVLVLAAVTCCGFVAVSFLLFARDQAAGATTHQVDELGVPAASVPVTPPPGSPLAVAPAPAARPAPARTAAQPRHFIDSVAAKLRSPFSAIVPSDKPWVERGVPTLIALLVYGLGLGYAARFTTGLG